MPEGHTLHRLAGALDGAFAGHQVHASSPQGRFAESAGLLDGSRVAGAEAYGKHLFLDFVDAPTVHVHLGLYGRFDVHPGVPEVPDPVGQVRLRLVAEHEAGTAAYADLRGATACELMSAEEQTTLLARLGPDPLRPDAEPDRAWERIRNSRAPIAGLLMDQSVVAGIGNVYRAELLFRHRLDPFRPGRTLRARQWHQMWDDLVDLMREGVRTGRIDTVRPEHLEAVEIADPQVRPRFNYVYRRTGDPCRVCGATVRTQEIAGRNLFWCGRCQRRFRGAGSV